MHIKSFLRVWELQNMKCSLILIATITLVTACQANLDPILIAKPVLGGGIGGGNTSPREIDKFKTPRPSKICGKAGWDYLRREFFDTNCAACHSGSFPAPYQFGSLNTETAYQEVLQIPSQTLLHTSTTNKFLSEASHLSTGGEVYQGILEWTENSRTCP